MITPTGKDRAAFGEFKRIVASLQAESERAFPEYKGSNWQFETMIVSRGAECGLTRGRLKRLVALGWLSSRPSDGCGPQLAAKPASTI